VGLTSAGTGATAIHSPGSRRLFPLLCRPTGASAERRVVKARERVRLANT
jgi:hypothetical protein